MIARIAPEARVIDVTHGIARHDVRSGALVLRRALPYFPAGVHLAVVDPEVGGERRAVALRTAEEDRILVGPDNGLLALAARALRRRASRRSTSARSPHRLEPASATFHGRDLFAPVAAHLAAGAPLADAGDPIDPDELVGAGHAAAPARDDGGARRPRARLRPLRQRHARRRARRAGRLGPAARPPGDASTTSRRTTRRRSPTSPPGELLLYEDAYRTLALAVNRGSAAQHLGLDLDAEVRIRAARERVRSAARACTCARRPRRTTARARSPRPARRTGRSSPPASSPPGAGARAARGRRRRGARC